MTGKEWKQVSSVLTHLHEKEGVGVAALQQVKYLEGRDVVNLTPDEELLRTKGRHLSPKAVRTWCWEHRKRRRFQRENLVLWSVYVEDEDASYVGLGAITTPEAAAKMTELQDVHA